MIRRAQKGIRYYFYRLSRLSYLYRTSRTSAFTTKYVRKQVKDVVYPFSRVFLSLTSFSFSIINYQSLNKPKIIVNNIDKMHTFLFTIQK